MKKKPGLIQQLLMMAVLLLLHATEAAQVKTVLIPASSFDALAITPGNMPTITFDIKTIPVDARIDSCRLNLTVAGDVNGKMVLDVLFAGKTIPQGLRNNRINFVSLDRSYKKDTIVTITMDPRFVSASLANSLPIALKTGNDNSTIRAVFYPNNINNASYDPGKAPRLVVYYSLSTEPPSGWMAAHADAQHSTHTLMRLRGSVPAAFEAKPVSVFSSIQTDLLSYGNVIYLVDNANSKTTLYAVDPVTRLQRIVADNLPPAVTMSAVDQFGKLYYISANQVDVIDLAGGYRKTPAISFSNNRQVTAPPVIGSDGSLYLVLNDIVYAYSPYPQHQLLWQYSLPGMKSPVTLNWAGTIAYVVSYRPDSILAINTTNGRKLYSAPLKLNYDVNEGATIPLVGNEGYVYVANKLTDADTMYVFDSRLNRMQSIGGSQISQPASGTDSTVYFINNGSLVKCFPRTNSTVAVFGNSISVRSLAADMSNNAYCLDNKNLLHLYYSNQTTETAANLTANTGFQKALIIGDDGSLYTATSSQLYCFRPRSFTSDCALTSQDGQLNNSVFRGNIVTVPGSFLLSKKKVLAAKQNVNISGNVTVDRKADITFETGGTISFKPGFKVQQGARLSCKIGY